MFPDQIDRYALEGRVVTMDDSYTVLERGTVYVEGNRIAAVTPTGAPVPPGFAGAPVIWTRATIYPGLIDLHNHLSYDALTLWDVPRTYTNRAQWGREPDYRRLISGPMDVLGTTPGYVEAVVRYVECKCLLGGVTTAQGLSLYSNHGIVRYYRGVVRNVEQTDEPDLPEATTRIADVEAGDAERFLARLRDSSCLLLHLAEGIDASAHRHFEALRMDDGEWAITPALVGIHSVALTPEDFRVMGQRGGAMVWSPLSNLLLYGKTADLGAAGEGGVRVALGSDWSPSGSKNLLGELKVARSVSGETGAGFSDRDLVAMATSEAATLLGWQEALGSVQAGKRADMLVVYGRSGDPYALLLEARETAICLVVIDGVARLGNERLMGYLGGGTERWRVGSANRVLNLAPESADPVVGALTLSEARERLRDGLTRLPELARQMEQAALTSGAPAANPVWSLLLDHHEPENMALRHHLRFNREPTATRVSDLMRTLVPLSQLLGSLELDPLTASDDGKLLERLLGQRNLPPYVKADLSHLL